MPASIRVDRPDCPDALVEICFKMIQKRAQDRFQTMTEVIESLEQWLSTRDVVVESAPAPSTEPSADVRREPAPASSEVPLTPSAPVVNKVRPLPDQREREQGKREQRKVEPEDAGKVVIVTDEHDDTNPDDTENTMPTSSAAAAVEADGAVEDAAPDSELIDLDVEKFRGRSDSRRAPRDRRKAAGERMTRITRYTWFAVGTFVALTVILSLILLFTSL